MGYPKECVLSELLVEGVDYADYILLLGIRRVFNHYIKCFLVSLSCCKILELFGYFTENALREKK